MADFCFVYVNVADFHGRQICKIGITNNVMKRLNEFNNGLRHQSRHCSVVKGIRFSHSWASKAIDRTFAKLIEKTIKRKLKSIRIVEFGTEVFDVDGNVVVGLINGHL